jgi:hypothetical protein
MQLTSPVAAETNKLQPTKMIWIERFASALSSLFMLFVAIVKLMRPPAVVEGLRMPDTRNA